MQDQEANLSPDTLNTEEKTVVDPMPFVQRRFSLRAFTSVLLAVSFTVLCTSGIVLFLTPRGRTANWTGWTLVGLDKQEWGSLHINNSILFISIAVVHLILNWPVLLRYLRNKRLARMDKKAELAVALGIAAVCVAGPIFDMPPFSSVMSLNEDVKNYWEQDTAGATPQSQPPIPHAEELTLAELAETIQLTPEQVALALYAEQYEVDEPTQTLGQIAEKNQTTPSQLFTAIRNQFPDTRGWGRIGVQHSGQGEGGAAEGGLGPGGGQSRGMGQGRGRGQGDN